MQETPRSQNVQYFYTKDQNDNLNQCGVLLAGQVLAIPDHLTLYYTENKKDYNLEMNTLLGSQGTAFNDVPTISVGANSELTFSWDRGVHPTFFIYASSQVANSLSQALYGIIYPGQSGYYARVYDPPQDNPDLTYSLLEFRQYDTIPIAIAADPAPIQDALAITVTDGALTQQEVDDIVAAVSANAGQSVNLMDFIPPSWSQMVVSHGQALSQGYNIGV